MYALSIHTLWTSIIQKQARAYVSKQISVFLRVHVPDLGFTRAEPSYPPGGMMATKLFDQILFEESLDSLKGPSV
jgi:hypothetical protein